MSSPHIVKSVTMGELIRLNHNCSDFNTYKHYEAETFEHLTAQVLDRVAGIVSKIPREKLVYNNGRRKRGVRKTHYVFSLLHIPQYHKITDILG